MLGQGELPQLLGQGQVSSGGRREPGSVPGRRHLGRATTPVGAGLGEPAAVDGGRILQPSTGPPPESAEQESNLPCPKAPGVRPGAVPRRRPAEGWHRAARLLRRGPIPFSAISSVFKELFRRAGPDPFRHSGRPARTGAPPGRPRSGNIGNQLAPEGRCPRFRPGHKTKEPPPFGSGSLTVPGLAKVLVIPSRAPPFRGWPTYWLDRRTRASTRTSMRATSPGFVPRRNAGGPGRESRPRSAW